MRKTKLSNSVSNSSFYQFQLVEAPLNRSSANKDSETDVCQSTDVGEDCFQHFISIEFR